jgi:hypothetical protein
VDVEPSFGQVRAGRQIAAQIIGFLTPAYQLITPSEVELAAGPDGGLGVRSSARATVLRLRAARSPQFVSSWHSLCRMSQVLSLIAVFEPAGAGRYLVT